MADLDKKTEISSENGEDGSGVYMATFLYEARKNIVSFGIMLAMVFGIKETLLGSYRIPSESMVPTLQVGDLLFTWNLPYGLRLPFVFETVWQWSMPERGDIIVFRRDDDQYTVENETKVNLVKRVVGLPGETIEVKGSEVFINGTKLADGKSLWQLGGRTDFGPVKIPEGHLVVLGDNRDFSKDSRLWLSGPFLPIENIRGKAFFVYFSLNKISRAGTILR